MCVHMISDLTRKKKTFPHFDTLKLLQGLWHNFTYYKKKRSTGKGESPQRTTLEQHLCSYSVIKLRGGLEYQTDFSGVLPLKGWEPLTLNIFKLNIS